MFLKARVWTLQLLSEQPEQIHSLHNKESWQWLFPHIPIFTVRWDCFLVPQPSLSEEKKWNSSH
jgi:hypothetical protein